MFSLYSQRWLHSLSPTIKKSAWTREEDELLVELYATHGARWSAIAKCIPGRTDDACSKRNREALDPQLKKDEWTPEEDQKLLQVYSRIGGKWSQVGEEMQRRSGLACRNRSVYFRYCIMISVVERIQMAPAGVKTCISYAPRWYMGTPYSSTRATSPG